MPAADLRDTEAHRQFFRLTPPAERDGFYALADLLEAEGGSVPDVASDLAPRLGLPVAGWARLRLKLITLKLVTAYEADRPPPVQGSGPGRRMVPPRVWMLRLGPSGARLMRAAGQGGPKR